MELLLENLRKEFGGNTAVAGVTAVLEPGIYGLLGANGAGKTTLLRMICGVLRPTSGRVCLDGIPIDTLGAAYRDRLGYLPQDFVGYPQYSARDFLLYMAVLKGMTRSRAKPKVEELLRTVRLQEAGGKKLRTFSGGMRRRLGIAQALLNEPDLLILDEPTAGLDPKERVHFRNILEGYAQKKIVLLSTHIVSDLEAIAHKVFLMKDGCFQTQGTVSELLQQANGRVWELTVPSQEAETWQARMTVANLRYDGNSVTLRILADAKPAPAARPCIPTLEDLYLLYFPEEEGGDNP
ncbi:ATP-binding cassette domain-containing protein [uncultured Subdoligranulum sp.]|uniref:ATP-binding cassette domain-containing protein n=1 Tax=uncultured Subdoligranulum sp. TaxID=512298 RepID=UPI0026003601|nr:ATP-binding cassette domain-containing protein [uncultured Subdoligranulum sp.]